PEWSPARDLTWRLPLPPSLRRLPKVGVEGGLEVADAALLVARQSHGALAGAAHTPLDHREVGHVLVEDRGETAAQAVHAGERLVLAEMHRLDSPGDRAGGA